MKKLDTYYLDLARAELEKAVGDLHLAAQYLQDAGMEDNFWMYRALKRVTSSTYNLVKYVLIRRHNDLIFSARVDDK